MADYWMLSSRSPDRGDLATLTAKRDHPFRSWKGGTRFEPGAAPPKGPPAEPLRVEISSAGVLAELHLVPLPLVTSSFAELLRGAGVTNLDVYRVELGDRADYLAFNLVGKITSQAEAESSGLAMFWYQAGDLVVTAPVKAAIDALGSETLVLWPTQLWGNATQIVDLDVDVNLNMNATLNLDVDVIRSSS